MEAAKNRMIDDAATTIYQLTADERIRQQCEAREDYLRRQRGISSISGFFGDEKVASLCSITSLPPISIRSSIFTTTRDI